MNDLFDLRVDARQPAKQDESIPATAASEAVEKAQQPGIECRHGGSEHERPTASRNTYPYPNKPSWSKSERVIARKVFDAALKRELQEVMQEAKQMANRIKEPADVWDLERHLTQRRKDIDRRYEFRSSQLTQVFGMLLSEHQIREEELRGLREDKMKAIRCCAEVLSEDAA